MRKPSGRANSAVFAEDRGTGFGGIHSYFARRDSELSSAAGLSERDIWPDGVRSGHAFICFRAGIASGLGRQDDPEIFLSGKKRF